MPARYGSSAERWKNIMICIPASEGETAILIYRWGCVHVCARGSIQQAERQEVLLRGAGTVVLIKAQAGDTVGGAPLFIHQPPIPVGRVR